MFAFFSHVIINSYISTIESIQIEMMEVNKRARKGVKEREKCCFPKNFLANIGSLSHNFNDIKLRLAGE